MLRIPCAKAIDPSTIAGDTHHIVDIPAPVLNADRALHALLKRVAFSRHLNPTNIVEARRAFKRTARPPPFEYEPLADAPALLRELDTMQPPRDHPAGELVGQNIDGVHRLVSALHLRTPEAFDALNKGAGWYDGLTAAHHEYPRGAPAGPLDVSSKTMQQRLIDAFSLRGMNDWRVVPDEVMSARVLVDGAKRIVRVNPKSSFRTRDLTRLVVHEIDVHARRATNGAHQSLLCFQTGLPGSLATEEGLAMVAEEVSGSASPGALARQAEVVRAIHLARTAGFRDLFNHLSQRVSSGLAWGICLRVKRGLAKPGEAGVYAKDSVYLTGRNRVRAWLDDGGNINHMYVGKVSIDHPVADWIEQGWVTLQPVPAVWT